MGLKNEEFDFMGNMDFAVRAARHMWKNQMERVEAARRASNYYKVDFDDLFHAMTNSDSDHQGTPTGSRRNKGGQ